ncbi:MAG: hypothetical protein JKY65_17045 [Planctomycetes bacterium]|nr:hypothetical protein [Planctomycetota bacterium]
MHTVQDDAEGAPHAVGDLAPANAGMEAGQGCNRRDRGRADQHARPEVGQELSRLVDLVLDPPAEDLELVALAATLAALDRAAAQLGRAVEVIASLAEAALGYL